MRKYIVLLSLVLVFILPSLMFGHYPRANRELQLEQEAVLEKPVALERILIKDGDDVRKMELDTYILGVLLGEVPASFDMEALKAQSVASRTYTLRKVMKQNKHDTADVCTDASCCQAFVSAQKYLTGKGDSEDLNKMKKAVEATAGQVLTYQGSLIEATYFSSSGGMTEDAVEVWGASIPYLKPVSSPGEEIYQNFEREFIYTYQDFLACLQLPAGLSLSQDAIDISYTAGGGVDQMVIAGESYNGTQLRSLLNLPSTNISVSVDADTVTVTTKGNGHRVGMSQYGAEAMAVAGKEYDEILYHYYPGTKIETLTSEQMKALFDKAGNL